MADNQNSGIYIGIDIDGPSCMLSYWGQPMKEPETASLIPGEEMYAIPLILGKKYGMSRWYHGRKALDKIRQRQADGIDDLYEKALREEEVSIDGEMYASQELLTIFLRQLIHNPDFVPREANIRKLVITVPDVTQEAVSLFSFVGSRLGLAEGSFMLVDHRESFYYYALNQEPNLYRHEIMLFSCEDTTLSALRLVRDTTSRPQMIRLTKTSYTLDPMKKDRDFSRAIEELFEGHILSAVFLTGAGFDGDWMEESLDVLCKNRRVFLGQNLYTKGAVFAGMVRSGLRDWPFVYIGDYEMKMNLSLKVIRKNEMSFVTLIEAGASWYETRGECEVILDGTPEFECWIQRPDSRKADVQTLELRELPRRENRTTRLRITAVPLSDKSVKIDIRDLGFGEFVPGTNIVWEHTVELEDGDGTWES